jgi:1,4-dihydroxy-2-naphthoate octaprenyltransferase
MIALWWQASRPKTLLISIAVILLGNGLVPVAQMDSTLLLLSLLTALLLQTAVNLANDYFDGVRGIDGHERLGPQRVTQSGLLKPQHVRNAMLLCLALALVSGVLLLSVTPYSGSLFWLAGAMSLLAVLAYSAGPWPLASHALGEVTVFVFFGLLGVGGSYYLQTGEVSLRACLAACQLGLVVAAVMLVNNIRDRRSDMSAGKRTLAVLIGEHRARRLYALLVLFPGAVQLLLAQSWALLPAILMLVMGAGLAIRGFQLREEGLNTLLGQTSMACVVFAVLILVSTHLF